MLQEALVQYCKLEKIPAKKMIRPVDTRWNTMCGVIERALELRPALTTMLSQPKYMKGPGKLLHLRLEAEEWDLLQCLLPMLQVSV